VTVERVLRDCAAQLQHWAAEEQKELRVAVSPDLPPYPADERLLRRVLLNLLSNALKHTPPGTDVTLRALRSGTDAPLIIEVADTGPGIPDSLRDRLFEPYHTGSTTHTGRQSSTGLGLTLCRLAVEAHGGTIIALSGASGTMFRITLPPPVPQPASS
jgi:signal transduction histidine kinase